MSGDLDRAMAAMLMDMGSGSILDLIRVARLERARMMDAGEVQKAQDLTILVNDSVHLYRCALDLESDPEVVRRNSIARLLNTISPVLLSVQDIKSFKERGPLDAISTVISTLSDFASASQYLASSKLITEAHYRENMMEVEERLAEHIEASAEDVMERLSALSKLMDDLLLGDIPVVSKPFVPLLIWTLIVVMSYSGCR
ncbi:MAG: hypothetical protein QCI82_07045 [Candidatus Thermoplasmatota archaeon]|nr:hypothetical protein [Candidatus Thermoplasmatota archaeon]